MGKKTPKTPVPRRQAQQADYSARKLSNRQFACISVFSIAAAVAFVYWRGLKYPFIQDDWQILYELMRGQKTFISQAFSPHYVLYRPLGYVYFLLMFRLFGLNPLGFRIIALTMHVANSMMVVYLAYKITRHHFLAWATGIMYASAVRVHLEPLLWMVGFFDVGAMFFFLSSFVLFARRKTIASALLFLPGIFIKESIVILPAILILYTYFDAPSGQFSFRRLCSRVRPHLALLLVYLPVKFALIHGAAVNANDPYKISLFGYHLLTNLQALVSCSFNALCSFSTGGAMDLCVAVLIGLAMALSVSAAGKLRVRVVALLVGWAMLGVIPVLLLKNHLMMGYYLTYSLPPLILLTMLWARNIIGNRKLSGAVVTAVILFMTLANVFAAADSFAQQDEAGIAAAPIDDYLVSRAYFADMVKGYLQSRPSPVQKNTVFVIGDPIGRAYYPIEFEFRVLLRDDSIMAYTVPVIKRGDRLYDDFSKAGGKLSMDKSVPLILSDHGLEECR